jgi:Stress responsive A/B Barrel Domain
MTIQLDYFVHHVYLWLKKPLSRESRMKFENGLKQLVTIETIVGKHIGTPATTNRGVIDSSYSYSLLLIFKNKEDQDIYQTHPTHLKFIEECEELWEKLMVYDSVSITP